MNKLVQDCFGEMGKQVSPYVHRISCLNLELQWHLCVLQANGSSQDDFEFLKGFWLKVPPFIRAKHLDLKRRNIEFAYSQNALLCDAYEVHGDVFEKNKEAHDTLSQLVIIFSSISVSLSAFTILLSSLLSKHGYTLGAPPSQ